MRPNPIDSDASRLALIANAMQSFRTVQLTRTWKEKVAAIARMNSSRKFARTAKSKQAFA